MLCTRVSFKNSVYRFFVTTTSLFRFVKDEIERIPVTAEIKAGVVENPDIKSVVMCGIETHACIHHTAIDLIERGIEVWLKGYSDVKLM